MVAAPSSAGALQEDEIEHMARRLDGLAVKTGDRVRIALFGGSHRDFQVIRTEPDGPVMIHPDTLLAVESARGGAPSQAAREAEDIVTYDDLGGMEREVAKIREMIELPLSHPEIFERLGMTPPKGVLLHGLPGCGKTLLARAVAHESDAEFIYVSGPEIIQKFYGESEAQLRKIFDDARKRAPCIIFFDEIDSLAPKRERVEGEVEKRVVAQLLALMDGLKSRGDVIVMAATNRPNAIDPALRRPGRFDREIAIGIPNEKARRDILEIYARGMPLGEGVDLADLARDDARLHRRRSQRALPRGRDGGAASPASGAAGTTPEPQKGSRTTSPSRLNSLTNAPAMPDFSFPTYGDSWWMELSFALKHPFQSDPVIAA